VTVAVVTLALVVTAVVVEAATRGAMTRRAIREISCLFIRLELAAMRLVRWVYPPRFVLTGECHRRGVCCRHIIGDPPALIRRTRLLSLWTGYHALAHDFHVVGRGPNDEIIFACGHLQSDGRCGIYRLRPFICRNYPVLPFFASPQLLPGCGYRVAPRVVALMRNRTALPIVNAFVSVHHPNPPAGSEALPEHFELVDDWPRPGDATPAAGPEESRR
jgi:hypothetical protein